MLTTKLQSIQNHRRLIGTVSLQKCARNDLLFTAFRVIYVVPKKKGGMKNAD